MTGWLLSMSGALGVYLLYTRWAFGRRTVLQLGWSPLQQDDPRTWMDLELYDGIKLRR